MASGGATSLGSGAALTITATPAPVSYLQNFVEDLDFIWDLITFQPFQKVLTGGVIGTHACIAAAVLNPQIFPGVGPTHSALGQAALTITETPTGTGFGEYYSNTELTVDIPINEFNAPVELTYFPVTGYWYDVESPPLTGGSNQLQFQVISAFVTFWPGYIDINGAPQVFPQGFTTLVENLDLGDQVGFDVAVALAPIQARILEGQLETIDHNNAAGLNLLANTDILNLDGQGYSQLIYNVQFTDVVYANNTQQLANFSFIASTDETALCITDPGMFRMPYGGPAVGLAPPGAT